LILLGAPTTESAPKASTSKTKYLGIGIGAGIAAVIGAIAILGSFNPVGLSSLGGNNLQVLIPFVDKDPDKDGLTTDEEFTLGTNPNLSDTDGDGLNDAQEKARGTNPNWSDTDGDGLNDKDEIDRGTNALSVDSDGDTLTDREEVFSGTDPLSSDSDSDSLNDGEERSIGTSPLDPDSDDDSLNDGRETAIGTNPLNRNTDSDRYDDSDDSMPTSRNTAVVRLDATDTKTDVNWINLGIAAVAVYLGGLPNLGSEIATASTDVAVRNTGTDYTSYVSFDVIVKVGNDEIMRIREHLNRLDEGQAMQEHYEYKITAKDVPKYLFQLIKDGESSFSLTVQNISYEKY
jgi:hypothetical protein